VVSLPKKPSHHPACSISMQLLAVLLVEYLLQQQFLLQLVRWCACSPKAPSSCLHPQGTLEQTCWVGVVLCSDVNLCTQGWLTRPLAMPSTSSTKNQLAAETGLTGASRTLRATTSRHPELVHAGYRWICPCLASSLELF
jgi:hypothetical protein